VINLVLGTQLVPGDQQHVLAAYVHRFTRNHKPQWASGTWKDGKPFPVQFASDADWLAHTRFTVRQDGRLDQRVHHCESNPTWPDNPELRGGGQR
jgi:hypothetical protein